MYREIPEELRRLIEPIVEEHGLELVDVQAGGAGRGRLVRVTVDTPAGDGQVPVERCAEVSRELETQLDAADAVPGPYRLEVSSPGLERLLAREKDFVAALGREVRLETQLDAADAVPGPYRLEVSSPGLERLLAREKDFVAALGREVRLETRRPRDGRRRYRGRLLAFEAGEARLEVEGAEVAIPFDEVARAQAVYEFTPADFGRGTARNRR